MRGWGGRVGEDVGKREEVGVGHIDEEMNGLVGWRVGGRGGPGG